MPTPQRTTRKPTALPSWPSCLLSGIDHAGKSVAAAQASASDLIGRTFWIEYGESTADAYGALPGVRYEIVEHDGSYLDVLNALRWASEQPREHPDKPNLIVFDSGSELWSVLSEEQAIIARARRKKSEAEDVTITPDQWVLAGSRFNKLLAILRKHDGPTVITARLKENMVMDARGNPTKDKVWEPEIQKKARYALNLTIEMRGHREYLLTGSRDIGAFHLPKGSAGMELPDDFTFDGLWRRMGLDKVGATSAPRIVEGDAAAGVREQESAAVAAAGDDENVPLPTQVEILDLVRDVVANAAEQPDVAAQALSLVLQQHGDRLNTVGPFTLSGGQVGAKAYLEAALKHVRSLPKPQQPERDTVMAPDGSEQPDPYSPEDGGDQPVTEEDRADAAQQLFEKPGPSEQPLSSAREALEQHADEIAVGYEPGNLGETQMKRIIEQGETANAAARPEPAAPGTPTAEQQQAVKEQRDAAIQPPADVRALWLDEIAVHAKARGVQPQEYVRPLLEAGELQSIADVPDNKLQLWTAAQRKPIAGALRQHGQEDAAKRLEKQKSKEPAPTSYLFPPQR